MDERKGRTEDRQIETDKEADAEKRRNRGRWYSEKTQVTTTRAWLNADCTVDDAAGEGRGGVGKGRERGGRGLGTVGVVMMTTCE